MDYKYYKFSILALIVCLTSCLKDQGNYDYRAINDISISGIETEKKYEVYAFIDTLKIRPDIAGKLSNDESRFIYEWKVMPRGGDQMADSINHVVSTNKHLNLPIVLEAGEYVGYYKVTDKVEGTDWGKQFHFLVKSLSNEGYMVLSEENGEGRLDMIATLTETEYKVAYDIWRDQEYNLGKPLALFFNYVRSNSNSLYVTSNGTYRLDKNLYTNDRLNLTWSFGLNPDRVDLIGTKSTSFSYDAPREVHVVKGGDLYARNTQMAGSVFEYPINQIDGKDRFEASPIIGMPIPNNLASYWPYGHTILLYDNTNKQFLELRDKNQFPNVIQFAKGNLFSVKTGRDIVHAESTLNKYTFAILKEPGKQQFFLYGMLLGGNAVNSQEYYLEIKLANNDPIKRFAIHPVLPYVFYATDDKVYQFDYSQPTVPAKEVLNYSGQEIATMKFYPLVGWNAYQIWERNKAHILVIGRNKMNGETDPGNIDFYTAPSLGDPLVKKKTLTGFGKIIDIAQRER